MKQHRSVEGEQLVSGRRKASFKTLKSNPSDGIQHLPTEKACMLKLLSSHLISGP
jgi:hypothetical protein